MLRVRENIREEVRFLMPMFEHFIFKDSLARPLVSVRVEGGERKVACSTRWR